VSQCPIQFLFLDGFVLLLWHFTGHDDAMAIILAGHNPKIHLLGISTVAGNQDLEKTTNNALRVVQVAGKHIFSLLFAR
jgi:inosine-uridine nucleoside N-ribohydrolase